MVHGSLAALAVVARRAAAAPRPRKAALELTDAAVERVKMLLDKRNKVRLSRGLGAPQQGAMAGGSCGAQPAWRCLPAPNIGPPPLLAVHRRSSCGWA